MGGTVGFVDNAPHGTVMTLRVPTRLEPLLQAAQQQSQLQELQVDPDEAAARRVTPAVVTGTAAAAAAAATAAAAAAAAVADCTDALGEVLKVKRVLVSASAASLAYTLNCTSIHIVRVCIMRC
jgi:hypothetical protein